MNQDAVKKILLETEDTELEFSVIFTGKASKKVNGLYKPDTHEILLHNKNFSNDNELIYTAIHEYTHHKQCEKDGGFYSTRVHTPKFWTEFHRLLEKAEQKGFYKLTVEQSPELSALTEQIKHVIMAEDGKLMRELGRLLGKARTLCKQAGVRYEDYIDRVLCLPRPAAAAMEKISAYDVNPNIGYEAMKIVANIGNPDKRREAENLFLAKNSPAAVRGKLVPKKEEDPRRNLEKEKRRLEKTILSLQARLESIETQLANMPVQTFIIALVLSLALLRPLHAQDKSGGSSIPEIPSIPNIEIPQTGAPVKPTIPKPFKIRPPKIDKTDYKNSPSYLKPSDYISFLEKTEKGGKLKMLINEQITAGAADENILNLIIENFNAIDMADKEKIRAVKERQKAAIQLKVFKINGKDISADFSEFKVSVLTENKDFLAVGEANGNNQNTDREELFIFAKKTAAEKYKLFIKLRQAEKYAFSPLYKFERYSPLEADIIKNMIVAQIENKDLYLLLIFNMEG